MIFNEKRTNEILHDSITRSMSPEVKRYWLTYLSLCDSANIYEAEKAMHTQMEAMFNTDAFKRIYKEIKRLFNCFDKEEDRLTKVLLAYAYLDRKFEYAKMVGIETIASKKTLECITYCINEFEILRPIIHERYFLYWYILAINMKGLLLSDLKRYQESIQYFKSVIHMDPSYAYAYANIANDYTQMEDNENAVIWYSKSLEVDPEYSVAIINRGCVYRDLSMYEKALADFHRAAELDDRDHYAWYYLSICHQELGNSVQSLSYAKRAILVSQEVFVEDQYDEMKSEIHQRSECSLSAVLLP